MPSTCKPHLLGRGGCRSARRLRSSPSIAQLQAVALEAVFDRDLAVARRGSGPAATATDCCASRRATCASTLASRRRWAWRGQGRGGRVQPLGVLVGQRRGQRGRIVPHRENACRSGPRRNSGCSSVAHQQLAIGAQPVNLRPRQRVAQPPGRFGARGSVDDDLGQHRIVVRRDDGRLVDGRIDAHAGRCGNRESGAACRPTGR